MEAAERALFERSVRHAAETATGAPLDAALEDLGWRDALEDDRAVAVSVLFESLGATGASSAALDRLLSAALGASLDAAVVLPRLQHDGPPGRREGNHYDVCGVGTASLAGADSLLVVIAEDGTDNGGSGKACAIETARLGCRPVQGLDPALGLTEVTGRFEAAEAAPPLAVDWPGALALGQLALGHELVGAGRAMLDLARAHALERIQFGRPIATFQAVRHRLAESLVALDAAAALLDAAWEDPSPVTAAMAKAFAGRSARTVARHCQQVLAGIGFTTEHPLHRFVRRTVVLDQLLGAGSVLTRDLGTDVLQRATLPPAFPL